MSNTSQLHITNGDSAANIIKASSVGGDVLPWRDPMHHGPFPANHDLDKIAEIRAEYLAGNYMDVDDIKREFCLRNEQLRAFSHYDEVILWFEHDLLDQLQILELLDWFSNADLASTTLSMICINEFPGVPTFRGIGQLGGEDIRTLLPTRTAVTQSQMQLAKQVWACFGSDEPGCLENTVRTDTSALPFLDKALQRHLQEYPWVNDGLTRTERQILDLVSSGVTCPVDVFTKNMESEDVLYIGDWTTYRVIARLCDVKTPLLSCSPEERFRRPPAQSVNSDAFQRQSLSLTNTGGEVLAGTRSARSLIVRDDWYGGVHLASGGPLWMWDDAASRVMLVAD